MEQKIFKSGFVNILGRPNVGKSTLMNLLVGEQMSIITPKPQTTRHRIIGIVSGDTFQIVFSDTPGVVKNPSYKMHQALNDAAFSGLEDADILLFMTDTLENYQDDDQIIQRLNNLTVPKYLIINKIDLIGKERIKTLVETWKARVPFKETFTISALKNVGIQPILQSIVNDLPEGPEYYPKDQLTDRLERFFVTEIIREKIFLLYHEEIPYSCEVRIESFKDTVTNAGAPIARIAAEIYVARNTQKMILLGKDGSSIKKLGSNARQHLEKYLEKKVFLELKVNVKEDWRDDEKALKLFGY
jgi:GTP-binding protein Era